MQTKYHRWIQKQYGQSWKALHIGMCLKDVLFVLTINWTK